ncbi:MAG: hypothetical protein Q9221_001004 [Calogaya cf. arnoldii]
MTITSLTQESRSIASSLKHTGGCQSTVCSTDAVRIVNRLRTHGEVLNASSILISNQLQQLAAFLKALFWLVHDALHVPTLVKQRFDPLSPCIVSLDLINGERAQHAAAGYTLKSLRFLLTNDIRLTWDIVEQYLGISLDILGRVDGLNPGFQVTMPSRTSIRTHLTTPGPTTVLMLVPCQVLLQ